MCNFAHGEKELRGLPNFKKTRLCIAYKNGDCPKASADCKYAHGEAELRKVTNTYRREESYYHKPRERQFRDDSRGNRERRD